MQIISGLFDHMVLQRNRQNVSCTPVSGSCRSRGTVQLRVSRDGRALRGLNWIKIGQATGKKFTARLNGIPVGGPYDIKLRIIERDKHAVASTSIKDVLVGDLWILAGQSNMEGYGTLFEQFKPDTTVRAFYMNQQWGIARHPLHQLELALDPVHSYINGAIPLPRKVRCVGPGLAFAQMMKQRTGIPQGLIPSAHGGSSMQQWDPALKRCPGRSLYGATIKRAQMNGGRVAGILWNQGSTDAISRQNKEYTRRMKRLIRAFRRDLADPKLPVVAVQMARHAPGESFKKVPWNDIQEQQRQLPYTIDQLAVVPIIDLELEDPIHLSGASHERLGRRLAQAMLALTLRPRQEKLPIELGSIDVKRESPNGYAIIEITFKNVMGRLAASGRPWGFSLSLDSHDPLPAIYSTELRGNRVVLHTSVPHCEIADYRLNYGLGVDPYCNITDQADRSLAVFGPVQLGKPRALTPFIQVWRVSKVLPSAAKLHKLARADTADRKVGWRQCKFPAKLADRHIELQALAPKDNLVVYACRFACPQAMSLALCLGHDGPVKVWINRKMIFHNPRGTNPAEPDAQRINFSAGKGIHELVIALGSNNGRAWGVFVRIERLGVSQKLLRQGPEAYALPELLG